ncbi:MAG: hypothetical protein M9938_05835 [Solirubrobacterales bacterium]|nr:hypothetical protein [Solirubrobacterales bacterium]
MTTTAEISSLSAMRVTATGALKSHTAEVADTSGTTLATTDGAGFVRAADSVLWEAPVIQEGGLKSYKDAFSSKTMVDINDAAGQPIGKIRVAKYRFAGRSKSFTFAVLDAAGDVVATIEPEEGSSDSYALKVGDTTVGTMTVETVKLGFLKRARKYEVHIIGDVPEPARTLLMVGVIRFDALADGVAATAMHSSI